MALRVISKIRCLKNVSLSSEVSTGPVEVAGVERFGAELVSTAVWVVGVNDISYTRSEDVLSLESGEPNLRAHESPFLHFAGYV